MPRVLADPKPKAARGARGGLSVLDLRQRLKALGLRVTGSKAELEERYEAATSAHEGKREREGDDGDEELPTSPKRAKVEASPKKSRKPSSPKTSSPKSSAKLEEPPSSPKRAKVEASPKKSRKLSSPKTSSPKSSAKLEPDTLERMVSDGDVGDPLDFEAELEAQLEGLGDFKPEQLEEATLADEAKEEKLEPGQASAGREAPALQEVNEVKEMCSAAMESEDLLPDEYRLQLESPHKDLIDMVMSSHAWWRAGLRSLVQSLNDLNEVDRAELPKKMDQMGASQLAKLLRRFQEAVERPLKSFSDHLKPALARRIHVGTMDLMGSSHEAYRRTFEFIELTNTWNDLDVPTRAISKTYRQLECGYRDPSMYKALARRAGDARDSFRVVVKVSCVATHILRLQQVQDWWPKLWQEKYQHLAPCTVAFLWQFPPSWVYSDEAYQRMERLVEYLASNKSGVQEARHIVDFRDGSWYREDVYEFLKKHRWCLAWLHLNNADGWASNLPSGWTDRVQTTNFCFCRLFGPDGRTHGIYDNKFLHELFDSCPMGTTSYVLFGNKETLEDKYPDPVPATMNAVTFRTIFTKMDFVERIREVRYQGKCPRVLNAEVSFRSESGGRSPTAWTSFEETLLINSFYLRFSQKARAHGIKVTSPVCSQWTQKYKPEAPMEKRSYEWYFPETKQRLHLGLHDAKEEEDLWIFLRQLTGLEDLNAAKEFIWNNAGKYGLEAFRREEVSLVLGCFVRWSEKARMMGLLSSTKLRAVHKDGKSVEFLLSNGEKLWMSSEDLKEEEDLWTWILDLSRVPMQSLVGAEEAREHDPWKDGSWKSKAREMWNRPVSDKVEVVSTPKQEAWWEDMAVRDEKANQATQSTQRCWKFEQGRCLYGEKCRFSHGEVPTAGSGQRGWRRQSWANGKVDTHNMKSFWGDG
ncbi:unnamed protein product [Durusdinium trenchii]|uniref:C3H1-type domain-containing protein n=1 Tax=Durusdinium trenchii TaxID=1381693 RepID=A0ABP0PG41_9DINO